jgi:8-oxo-dGTP pyrophosphatase MutT (NUDIX family)
MKSFETFIQHLKKEIDKPLPGKEVQFLMAPKVRLELLNAIKDYSSARESSVLILLYPFKDQVHSILTLRPEYQGFHSRQISFPGGKRENEDENNEATALRETNEEVGINSNKIELIGKLSDHYVYPSNFLIHPFIGIALEKPEFVPEKKEVEKIIEYPINQLIKPDTKQKKKISLSNGFKILAPYYAIEDQIVWGATAMILSEFEYVLSKIKEFNPEF